MLWGCQEVHQYPHESHRSASPLLVTMSICSLLNVTAAPALHGITPVQALSGQVPDISHLR